MDSWSNVTIIRKSLAHKLNMSITPKKVQIVGYGNIPSYETIGISQEEIHLGKCRVNVVLHVVPDEAQEEDTRCVRTRQNSRNDSSRKMVVL